MSPVVSRPVPEIFPVAPKLSNAISVRTRAAVPGCRGSVAIGGVADCRLRVAIARSRASGDSHVRRGLMRGVSAVKDGRTAPETTKRAFAGTGERSRRGIRRGSPLRQGSRGIAASMSMRSRGSQLVRGGSDDRVVNCGALEPGGGGMAPATAPRAAAWPDSAAITPHTAANTTSTGFMMYLRRRACARPPKIDKTTPSEHRPVPNGQVGHTRE